MASLTQSARLDCHLLLDKCKQFFVPQAQTILDLPEFLDSTAQLVIAVTCLNPLNASEFSLFSRCHAWATEECLRNKLDPTPTNIRSLMQPFLGNIVFSSMTNEQLSHVRKTGILSDAERLLVYDCKSDPNIKSPFASGVRRKVCPYNSTGTLWGNKCHDGFRCEKCRCSYCKNYTSCYNNQGYCIGPPDCGCLYAAVGCCKSR